MSTTATLAASAATAVLKKVFDDLYEGAKKSGRAFIARSRADLKDAAIARSIHSVTKVKTLWNIEKEVSLYDFYYPSNIEFSEGVRKRIIGVKDFGSIAKFVIQGTAGQGKSIFLRYLSGQELDGRSSSGRIPLFIELRRLRSDLDLNELTLQALERYKLPSTAEAWKTLAASGRVTLLLDAFDEVDPQLVTRTVTEIETIAEVYRDQIQIFVTSRPDADIQKSNAFRVVKLTPLSESDHQPFLKKICTDSDQSDSLLKALRASSVEVSNLLTTPLLMTLLVILYKSAQTIPDTVPKFYEELFDVLFYRHDHSKPGFRRKRFTTLDDGAVKEIFSAFCFFTRLENLGVLTSNQFQEACVRASQSCGIVVDSAALRNELVKTICLMQEDGFELSFIHKSVAQYYAASFVVRSSDEFAKQFYQLGKSERSWELELRFLSQIDRYRYTRYFERPLLEEFGAELGIDFDAPNLSDTPKLTKYFSKTTKLVVADPATQQAKGEAPNRTLFLGWSSHLAQSDPIRKDAIFWWIWPVMTHIESAMSNRGERPVTKDPHEFVPVTRFQSDLDHISKFASENTLEKIRQRYKLTTDIIETENRKTNLLAGLIKASTKSPK